MFEFAFMLQHNFCLILFIYLRLFCFVLEKELSRRNLIFFLKKGFSLPLGPASPPPSARPLLPLPLPSPCAPKWAAAQLTRPAAAHPAPLSPTR